MKLTNLSKNNESWNKLFQKYNILEKINQEGSFEITSKQINEFRESRLMTKFDHSTDLPDIFTKNDLAILPITRGSYIIAKIMAYEKIYFVNNREDITPIEFPNHIESIDPNNLYSESAVLNCAYVSGIIEDVLGETPLPTVSGRMSTSKFNFNIKLKNGRTNIQVNNSQCEIDAGYESDSKFMIIEAKNFLPNDFLIRQLYFPYRLWKNKIRKEVIPVFMTYSNDVFSFFIYEFQDPEDYNSLKLVAQKDYALSSQPISLSEIENLTNKLKTMKEPDVPFPQANKFERLIDLLSLLMSKEYSKEEITSNYDTLEHGFHGRQTDYYVNAGVYLRLIDILKEDNEETVIKISSEGKQIMKKPHKDKVLLLAQQILKHEVFNECFKKYFNKNGNLTIEDIVHIMKKYPIYKVNSETTIKRRASTVYRWIDWIVSLQEE